MLLLDIILVIIGLGAVVLSFRIADKPEPVVEKGKEEELPAQELENILEEKKKKIEDMAEEVSLETEDKLSSLSNEKIMGLSEYSQQVFDKMEKNHAETVFLYDMLNQKEQEIKELVHDVDVAKANLHDEWMKEYQERKAYEEQFSFSLENDKSSVYDAEIARIEEEERKNRMIAQMYTGKSRQKETDVEEVSEIPADIPDIADDEYAETTAETGTADAQDVLKNRNEEILAMYKEGRSLLEISKILSVGQGEAKFVIDMYKAR